MSARVEEEPVALAKADDAPAEERPLSRSSGRGMTPGLELTCTQLAVDFQGLTTDTAAERLTTGLKALTDACGADSVFVALLDEAGKGFETIYAGRSTFSGCNPEVLKDRELAEFPWIKARLGHLRLLEIKDTAKPAASQHDDARELASLNVGGLLVVGFNIRGRLGGMLGVCSAVPNPEWAAELHLALKLLGASCASGLERIELTEDLADVQERDRLVSNTANDGLWDYDVRENSMYFSPRWRAMLGYSNDHDVPEWRLLVHADDLAHVQTQLREHLERRTELFESVHRMQHASG